MVNVKKLIASVKDAPIRLHATDKATAFLSRTGWFPIEREDFDVYAVRSDGHQVVIKFWINLSKKPVPKFFIKKFDRAIQRLHQEKDLDPSKFEAYFISNAVLDNEAYNYFKNFGRFSMNLFFTSDDIKEQIESIRATSKQSIEKYQQKQLIQFCL
ncbi:MAG: hypothetical protein ACFFCS_08300 [Candidatus Hodarchaeota archaeon]